VKKNICDYFTFSPVLTEIWISSIWELLLDLTSNEGKTVIITTHYIEEAKQSQMVKRVFIKFL